MFFNVVIMYKEKSNQRLVEQPLAKMQYIHESNTLELTGAWLWKTLQQKDFAALAKKIAGTISQIKIDGSKIVAIDTVGAYFISRILTYANNHNIKVTDFLIPESGKPFFERIDKIATDKREVFDKPKSGFVASIGESFVEFIISGLHFIAFFGQFILNCVHFSRHPRQLNWNDLVRTIFDAGLKGMGVASLLSFLIGVTLAYQMAPQFITYGANVYVVNFLGIALLKEVSPLLTAIIVAGRTGAAITAEIGTMKVLEEIDAIQTMGISPITRLVLPKVIGVVIAVPLITSIGDVASMVGGAIVSNYSLDVNYSLFIERVKAYVAMSNYTIGIYKSIVFAFLIALVGCYCGFKVRGDANSIGEQTTRSVVLGIVLIVFSDAVIAVICKVIGV
jgi:phospholipid/cholesterol/gamma-HCH transport system permease protein